DLHGLEPRQLLDAANAARIRPLVDALLHDTLDHFHEAVQYTVAIPRHCYRLRLACPWPIMIGLETLLAHKRNPHWLEPEHASRISRLRLYRILVTSLPCASSNAAIRRWADRLFRKTEAQLPC